MNNKKERMIKLLTERFKGIFDKDLERYTDMIENYSLDELKEHFKNNELRGYGHQIGNLVPCCKECNSKKGSKDYKVFIHEHNKIRKNKENLINLLSSYQETYSTKLNFEKLKASQEYEDFLIIKDKIFELMKEADLIAEKIRKNILI